MKMAASAKNSTVLLGIASLTWIGCAGVSLPLGGAHAPPPLAGATTAAPKVKAPAAGADCPTPAADAGKNAGPSERGFTPATTDELLAGAYTGKTMFMGVTMERNLTDSSYSEWGLDRPREYIWAGDPVTVCLVKENTTTMTGPKGAATYKTASIALVKTLDGERRVVDPALLSSKPLFYSLRAPGQAEHFLRALFIEGLRDGKFVQEKVEAGHFDLEGHVGEGGTARVNELYRQHQAYQTIVKEVASYLNPMARGHQNRASILRSRETAWIVKADDKNILEWQVEGPPKTGPYEGMAGCVQGLVTVIGLQLSYHFKQVEIDTKPWRQGLRNASQEQIEALDKAEIARRKKDADGQLKFMSDGLTSKSCKEGVRYTESKMK